MGEFAGAFATVNFAFNELISLTKRAVSGVVNFGKQSIKSFSHFQQLESSLQGLMRSEEKGTQLFEHLRSFSFDTTFGVDTLASASQQLLGVGVAVEDLDSTLMMIGNVASGDTQKFNELVSVFAKIQNQGKASSIQLQQLALRGVPIYQMLKQMGVEGKASGEDITEAFRKMTSEGGQFENAMERINNTIQGKEGFVSDTWREFLTSFAEASGIADVYKKALDVIYNALQGIVDWLQKINENPVYQAVFRGVLVTIIGAIGSALLLKLIPVIATLIKSIMTLTGVMTAFNTTNPFGWIALAVSGIAGLTVAYKSLNKEAKEYSDIDLEQKRRNTMEELQKKVDKGKATMQEKYDLASMQVAYWEKQLAGGFGDYGINLEDEYEVIEAQTELKRWKENLKEYSKRVSAQQVHNGLKDGTLKATTPSTGSTWSNDEDTSALKNQINILDEWQKKLQVYLKQKQAIEDEMALLGLEGEALLKMKYIQQGFTEEQAIVLAQEQHKLDLMNEEIEAGKERAEQLKREKELRKQLEENANYSLSGAQELVKADGDVAEYYGLEFLKNSKIGSVANATMEGAMLGGEVGAIVGLLAGVLTQLDGFSRLLSGLDQLFEDFIEPINDFLNLVADWLGIEKSVNSEKETELQRLKAINEQYQSLSTALDDQAQYYKEMKLLIANETERSLLEARGSYSVNDMILTPQGNFSTHPDDYIIATKDPSSLGANGSLNVTINDYAGVQVETQKIDNQLIVTLSKKVASDYAKGLNGWDSAVSSRQRRTAGTSYSR